MGIFGRHSFRGNSLLVGLFAVVLLVNQPQLQGEDSSDVRELSESLTVERHGLMFSRYFAHFYVGAIQPGVDLPLTLRIRNSSEDRLEIDTIQVSCSCLGATADSRTYLPGEEIVVDTVLQVPAKAASSTNVQSLSLSKGGLDQQKIEVKIEFEIVGLLNFLSPSSIMEFRASDREPTIRIPFAVSKPVRADQLEIDVRPRELVRKQEIGLDKTTGHPFVQLTLNSNEFAIVAEEIDLSLRDRNSDRADTTKITIRKRSDLDILPIRVRLRQQDENAIGTAILHLVGESPVDDDQPSPLPVVTATVGSKAFGVTVKRIHNGTYRLTIRTKAANLFDPRLNL